MYAVTRLFHSVNPAPVNANELGPRPQAAPAVAEALALDVIYARGTLVELKIWEVPEAVADEWRRCKARDSGLTACIASW